MLEKLKIITPGNKSDITHTQRPRPQIVPFQLQFFLLLEIRHDAHTSIDKSFLLWLIILHFSSATQTSPNQNCFSLRNPVNLFLTSIWWKLNFYCFSIFIKFNTNEGTINQILLQIILDFEIFMVVFPAPPTRNWHFHLHVSASRDWQEKSGCAHTTA